MMILMCKPNVRFAVGWIAVTALLCSLGLFSLMFDEGPIAHFPGLEEGRKQTILRSQVREVLNNSGLHYSSSCNTTFECNDAFAPVCSSNGQMFHSACIAGCSNYTRDESRKITKYFECDIFIWFVCILTFFAFIHGTSEVGSMLLTLRCVESNEKAMALGLILFAIGLFGNVH